MKHKPIWAILLGVLSVGVVNGAVINVSAEHNPSGTYNLTTTHGTQDWAIWDSAQAAPGLRKDGGTTIGDMSQINGDSTFRISTAAPGTGTSTTPEYSLTYTDGTSPNTTGDIGASLALYNILESVNSGLGFDVTATSADPFTVYMWGSVYRGTGTLTVTDVATPTTFDSLASAAVSIENGGDAFLYTTTISGHSVNDVFSFGFVLTDDGPGANSRTGIQAVSVIPEPSTTALLGLGGLALILRRRK